MLPSSFESLSADIIWKNVASKYTSSVSLLPQTEEANPPLSTKSAAPIPRWDSVFPDEPISIKIVPQRYLARGETSWKHRIGWISVTNTAGQIIYDPFVTYPKEPGLKKYFNHRKYSVGKEDLLFRNGARDGKEVEKNLKKLFHGRTVVVHGGKSYSDSCYYHHDSLRDSLVRDTQTLYSALQNDGQPTLSTVARLVLGRSIRHEGEDARRPDQDAAAAMQLYLLRFPYDRAAKGLEYEHRGGKTSPAPLQTALDRPKELRKAKSTFSLTTGLGSDVRLQRRPVTDEGARPPSAPPEKTLDAAAQFALRLQRRHFADVARHDHGGRESRQEVF